MDTILTFWCISPASIRDFFGLPSGQPADDVIIIDFFVYLVAREHRSRQQRDPLPYGFKVIFFLFNITITAVCVLNFRIGTFYDLIIRTITSEMMFTNFHESWKHRSVVEYIFLDSRYFRSFLLAVTHPIRFHNMYWSFHELLALLKYKSDKHFK